jgi:hypothetical protein
MCIFARLALMPMGKFGGLVGLRACESKKKESRASSDRDLTATRCPALLERCTQVTKKLEKARSALDADRCGVPKGTSRGRALAIFDNCFESLIASFRRGAAKEKKKLA